ncbi:MAG: cysteine desulfurase NifS [Candidatus Saccharimonadales bacterium]
MAGIKKTIYLDYAAATPMDGRVRTAIEPYFSEKYYNPSASYLAAKNVAKALLEARNQVAFHLGARSSEIIFTAGGTEANNLAVHGVMSQYPKSNVVVSAIEHDAILEPIAQYRHTVAPVQQDGRLKLSVLESSIDDNTVLVSVMQANNEIGTIEPLKRISLLVHSVRQQRLKRGVKLPIYFHTDACQAANYLDLHAAALGVDLMTINGGKIYGPKQCGALFVRTGIVLAPQVRGGGQERGMRSGTENVANIIGLATALDLVQTDRRQEAARIETLSREFMTTLTQTLPRVTINGSVKYRLPNNINATFAGQDNERLLMLLDERGVMCAAGSACAASSDETSHVLRAIGLTEQVARSTLRFTLGRQTSQAELTEVAGILRAIVN